MHLCGGEGSQYRGLLRILSRVTVGTSSSLRWLSLRAPKQLIGFAYDGLPQTYLPINGAVFDRVDNETGDDDTDDDLYRVHDKEAQ
jgi:hypothetical protein